MEQPLKFEVNPQPRQIIFRYPAPRSRNVDVNTFVRIENELLRHDQFRHLSVLDAPQMLSPEEFTAMQQQAQPVQQLDLTNPDRAAAIAALLADRASKNQGVVPEMEVLAAAVRADLDYAWSWHCNLAMSFWDEGGDIAAANRAAARFLQLLFKVDTTRHPAYFATQNGGNDTIELEPFVRVANSREEVYEAFLQVYQARKAATGVAPDLVGFRELDRAVISWPLAYQFGWSIQNSRRPIQLSYIAFGDAVKDAIAQGDAVKAAADAPAAA